MRMTKWLLLLLLLPAGLAGQGCCSGGTPLSGSLGLEPLTAKQGQIESMLDYNTQSTLVSGKGKLEDNPRNRLTYAGLLRLSYAFSNRWSLTGLLSWVRQEEKIDRIAGGTTTIRAQGPGDLMLLTQYAVLQENRYSLLVGAGIELPTGETSDANPDTGIPFHPDMQAGRGAVAWLGSTLFTYNGVLRPSGNVFAQATYRISSSAERYERLQSYRFGNELRLLTGYSDQLLIGEQLFAPSLMLLYRHTQKDLLNGLPSPNTGGQWLHLRTGLQWAVTPKIEIRSFAEWPLAWQLEGTQLTTALRARLSIRYQWYAK